MALFCYTVSRSVAVVFACHAHSIMEYILTGEGQAAEKDADAIRGISDDALKVGCLWDGLDEAGKAIILGDIYRRAEAMTMASDALTGEQLRAAK